jgi:predicted RNase H-like nuclease (RuvC/YqgF family)
MTDNVISIDPIAKAIEDADAEFAKEVGEEAKRQIIVSKRKIRQAEKVLANLKLEHEALLRDLRAGA